MADNNVEVRIVFSETRGYYTPTVKVDIVFGKVMKQGELIEYMLKFVKANKLELVPSCEEYNMPYPMVNFNFPSGIAIFAQFKTIQEASEFKKTFKLP